MEEFEVSNNKTTEQPVSSLPIQEYKEVFRNLTNAKRFAIDIGGSLTKIAYFSTVSHRRVSIKSSTLPNLNQNSNSNNDGLLPEPDFEYENWENPRLHFIKFETRFIEECLEFLRTHVVCRENKIIKATGGGAHKYTKLLQDKLNVTVDKEDEMTCLVKGSNFLLKNVPDEAFSYDKTRKNEEYKFQSPSSNIFPYLLVNIGSGVSILKVESEDKFERIGGSATGGGTFWGLGSLLTGTKSFDELLHLAEIGDHKNVDMLVKDIYAGSLSKLGLDEDTTASSFGKCILTDGDDGSKFNKADIIRSLLFTISNDIGQISSLYALRYGLKKIYFGGYFLRNHPVSMNAISFSIKFWGKGELEGLFLRHEGYVGAIGAFLIEAQEDGEHTAGSWTENFIGSSGHICAGGQENLKTKMEQLEIDKVEPFGFFPLLKSSCDYFPDTLDLSADTEARDYWLQCFETWIDKVPTRGIESQPNSPTALDRALRCRQKLLSRLQLLKSFPSAFGTLSVRSLLDMIEQTLREYDFPDPYLAQKQAENSIALMEFEARIEYLDSLPDPTMELIKGVLAGNFFDWGAKEITKILEGPDNFGFKEARNKLKSRPWLIDGTEAWLERLQNQPAHKCAVVFVDNSGYDFVLGILPLIRWLLHRGTDVIISANSTPALNDMTYSEMLPLMEQVSQLCPIIRKSMEESRLHLVANGQSSPCLDLSRVNQQLIQCVQREQVDLVIIEGMGRVIHTNLNAHFNCEVIKLAVCKNEWLGKRLGGEIFSIIFKYEK